MIRPGPLQRIQRIRARLTAGSPLAPEDAAILVKAIDAAIATGATIEMGLGLAPGWGSVLRRRARLSALQALSAIDEPDAGTRAFARQISRELALYAARQFRADQRSAQPPSGRSGMFFQLLVSNGGRVPSAESIRKILDLAG
ncbi:hypothetical protein [Mesorhizobium helmanticense]|uniref:Uncharacterized protein n=1 Tax=Mesorhizobium helmanticense TaxID=1776423 RepID=A0A2T4IP52_9HYPH|nr:hypothetical protein [Mesorhizobium helmanticense]PTE07399.1 hypothetical protein C9427_27250 [Mesorhizobium helmanticense]